MDRLNLVAVAEVRRNLPGEHGWESAGHSLLEVADHNLVAAPAHSLDEEAAVHSPIRVAGVRNLAASLLAVAWVDADPLSNLSWLRLGYYENDAVASFNSNTSYSLY